jgi:hypothetical protein
VLVELLLEIGLRIPDFAKGASSCLFKFYRRCNRRMRGDKLTSTHFEHGHLKAVSLGPQFLQIKRP